ncbi:MAG: hypothetical protein V1648_00125 [Candidatus Aenigmatarchaeota archaeon]
MKPVIILAIVLIIAAICLVALFSMQQNGSTTNTISGTLDLTLNAQDLQHLGMTEHECRTEDNYGNIVDSSPGQYTFCNYTTSELNDTEIIVELQKFENIEALNGTYQYSSLHLFSIQGLISENAYGDQSRFRVNNVNDYGGEFNEPGVYYYHLWITKNEYLIHIISGGRNQEAGDYVTRIGQQILSKFG